MMKRRTVVRAGTLVINLKTAKALGLTIPHSLLLRADGGPMAYSANLIALYQRVA